MALFLMKYLHLAHYILKMQKSSSMQFVTGVITSMPIAYSVKLNKAIKLNQPNIPPIRSVVQTILPAARASPTQHSSSTELLSTISIHYSFIH